MSDPIIILAESVVAIVAAAKTAGAFSPFVFTPQHSYPIWDDDFSDLKDLSVDVVFVSSGASGGDVVELDSFGSLSTEPAIDIAVRKRFDHPNDKGANGKLKKSSVDALVTLVGQIADSVAIDRMGTIELASGVSANWVSSAVRTYCDYQRLRQGMFLGAVRIRFEITKVSTP